MGQKGRRSSQCEMGRERGLGLMRAGGGEVNMIKNTKFSKGEKCLKRERAKTGSHHLLSILSAVLVHSQYLLNVHVPGRDN